MRPSRGLFTLLGLAMMLPVLVGCSALSSLWAGATKPSVKDIRPRIAGIDFEGVNMMFDVDVANPYAFALKSPRFDYAFDVNGVNFMKATEKMAVDLPARRTGTLNLPVRLGYLDMWKAYEGLRNATEIPYTLRGALALPVMGKDIELPLTKSGVLPVLKVPQFTVKSVKPGEMSLTRAGLDLTVALKNPNAFGVGLDDLGYALRLGDLEVGGLKVSNAGKVAAGATKDIGLHGEISGLDAVRQIAKGVEVGKASIRATGSIKTPYGDIRLPEAPKGR